MRKTLSTINVLNLVSEKMKWILEGNTALFSCLFQNINHFCIRDMEPQAKDLITSLEETFGLTLFNLELENLERI